MSELFKARWKYSEDPEKKKGKRAHQATSVAVGAAGGYGGYKMGEKLGDQYRHARFMGSSRGESTKRAFKMASRTKGFRQGAAIAGGAVLAGGVADHVARKKDVLVRKNSDHADSPFLISKALSPQAGASLAAHAGSIPRNSSKFKLGDKLGPARGKKQALLAPYKGGVPKTRSELPLQARKASARLDNR